MTCARPPSDVFFPDILRGQPRRGPRFPLHPSSAPRASCAWTRRLSTTPPLRQPPGFHRHQGRVLCIGPRDQRPPAGSRRCLVFRRDLATKPTFWPRSTIGPPTSESATRSAPSDLGRLGLQLSVRQTGLNLDLAPRPASAPASARVILPVLGDVPPERRPARSCSSSNPSYTLNPGVQQRLADFLLAVVASGRQLIVETHSDYLVTRLRRRTAEDLTGLRVAASRWFSPSATMQPPLASRRSSLRPTGR